METIVIPYSPYDYQEKVHLDEHRFRLIVGGRRVGKSHLAIQELLRHLLSKERQLGWWVAPTYKDAREIGWEEFLAFSEYLAPALEEIHHSQLRIRFTNGSLLYFKGSDNPDGLRGRGLDFVVLDEAAFMKEDVWKKCIRPTLSDKHGRALFTSTPNGHNWFYEQYLYAGYPSSLTWSCYHWPTWCNPLITTDDLEAAKNELSTIDFKQEYGAEFVTKAGLVYDEFNEHNIVESFRIDTTTQDFYIGLDFGFASFTAVCFMAVDRLTSTVTMFDELFVSRHDVDQVINLIISKQNTWKIKLQGIFCDPAGNAEELTSGISPVDALRNKGFNVISKGTKIPPGLSLVRSFILNASGVRRFFVCKSCNQAIKSFRAYSYKQGVRGIVLEDPDKDNVHDHMMDAIRYFFVNKFDQAKWIGTTPKQTPYSTPTRTSVILKRCGVCHNKFVSKTPKDQPPHVCMACQSRVNNDR